MARTCRNSARLRRAASAEQTGEKILYLPVHRHLTIRREVVDELGQNARDGRGGRVDIDTVLLGKLLDELAAQHLLNLLRANRQILAGADPGLNEMTETSAFELLEQPAEPLARAMVRDERTGEIGEELGFVSATEDGAEERIE